MKKSPKVNGELPKKVKKSKDKIECYKDYQLFQIYDFAKTGYNQKQIAEAIGVEWKVFSKWYKQYPLVKKAVAYGKNYTQEIASGTSFKDYVYEKLPEDLKEVWNKITQWEDSDNSYNLITTLLKSKGREAKQYLFIHALITKSFNPSEALKALCMKKSELDNWMLAGDGFAELINQIQWHKGNFFEEALISAVGRGDTAAIIFANKTFNAQRGYESKLSVDISGTVAHNHTHTDIGIDDLDLPLEIKLQILDALEKKRSLANGPVMTQAIAVQAISNGEYHE